MKAGEFLLATESFVDALRQCAEGKADDEFVCIEDTLGAWCEEYDCPRQDLALPGYLTAGAIRSAVRAAHGVIARREGLEDFIETGRER